MEKIYSKLIGEILYDKINCVSDFDLTRKQIRNVLTTLELFELNNLKFYTYRKRIELEKKKETCFTSSLPFVLIVPSVFAGYLSSIFSSKHNFIDGFVVACFYLLISAFLIIPVNDYLMNKYTNGIKEHLFLEQIINDEIKIRNTFK